MHYWFAGFSVDSTTRLLCEGEKRLPLKPKHVQVLALLLDRRPNILSNSEILDVIWSSGDASETYVTTAISEIKRCLRDKEDRYVLNVYAQGYAFVYPSVSVLPQTSERAHDVGPRSTQAELPPRSLGQQAAPILRARRVTSTWHILDNTGTARRINRMEGLEVERGVILPYIRARSLLWTPGSSLREKPTIVQDSDFPKKVTLEPAEESDPKMSNWRIMIAGSLTDADPPLSYTMSTTYDRAVLMSNDAVAAAYSKDEFKYDYRSWYAELAVEWLELRVEFPDDVSADFFPGVFWGPSEWYFDHVELSRVSRGFAAGRHLATLVVEKPRCGFRYFIYWCFK